MPNVYIPRLESDKWRGDRPLMAREKLERKIVANLVAYMGAAGFVPEYVWDGGCKEKCHDAKSAMEAIFAVDESSLVFRKPGGKAHSVVLVLGNDGFDVIADWGYSEGDADGFNAAMEAFSVIVDEKWGPK